MIRVVSAYLLALLVALTSLSFAAARGTNPDLGTDIVICTGVGMTTITVGADGQPIEKSDLCPEAASIFAATFSVPSVDRPASRLIAELAAAAPAYPPAFQELSPSARGPPALV